MSSYVVVGTWNTKGEELDFLCDEIGRLGHRAIKLDASSQVVSDSRDASISAAKDRAVKKLKDIMEKEEIAGAAAVGGGTLLFMAVGIMENLPLLMPKVIVSTMVANSLPAFRSHKDITYIQSPCDFGALNPLSKSVLENAARALTAMKEGLPEMERGAIAITAIGIMGVYTEEIKAFWREKNFALVPFHSAGESTMAMAELGRANFFSGILDLALHDVIDYVALGAYGNINRERLRSYLSMDVPAVIAPGAVDAVAFVPKDNSVPPRFRKRNLYRHDFRWAFKTTRREAVEAARWIGGIVEETKPEHMLFLIPLKGWSYPGDEGKSFYDPALMEAFQKQLRRFVRDDQLVAVDLSINDPRFGIMASQRLCDLMERKSRAPE